MGGLIQDIISDLKYLYKPKMPFKEAEKIDNIFRRHYNGFPME